MRRYYFLLPLFVILQTGCAQTKRTIKNVSAFYTVTMPGNIQVGADGDETERDDTSFVVYLETGSSGAIWVKAERNNRSYDIEAVEEKAFPVHAGESKLTNQPILITPSSGNRLWKLRFLRTPGIKAGHSKNELILYGRSGNKKFVYRIENLIEIKVRRSM